MIRKILCCTALIAGAVAAHAQAVPAAIRGADIEAGGFVGYVRPDYAQKNPISIGIVGDLNTRSFYGLEAEGNLTIANNEPNESELTFAIGPRFYHVFNTRYIAYAKVLGGIGHFDFPQNLEGGSTNFEYTLGGGLDYRLKRHITLRVPDFEYQSWPGFGNANDVHRRGGSLTPVVISVGVKYRF